MLNRQTSTAADRLKAKRKEWRRQLAIRRAAGAHVPGYGPGTRPNPNAGKVCVRGFKGCGATPGTYNPTTRKQDGRKAHSKSCTTAWKAAGSVFKNGAHAHRNKKRKT